MINNISLLDFLDETVNFWVTLSALIGKIKLIYTAEYHGEKEINSKKAKRQLTHRIYKHDHTSNAFSRISNDFSRRLVKWSRSTGHLNFFFGRHYYFFSFYTVFNFKLFRIRSLSSPRSRDLAYILPFSRLSFSPSSCTWNFFSRFGLRFSKFRLPAQPFFSLFHSSFLIHRTSRANLRLNTLMPKW